MTYDEDEPMDLFDAICRLDVIAEWLRTGEYVEADILQDVSEALKGYIVITLRNPDPAARP